MSELTCVRQTYIEFFYPYAIKAITVVHEVQSPDALKVKITDGAYCFKFFDILSATVDLNGEKVKLVSKRVNVSPTYYYGGMVYTLAEVKKNFPNERVMIRGAEVGGWKKLIQTRNKSWWQPFNEDTDVLLEGV